MSKQYGAESIKLLQFPDAMTRNCKQSMKIIDCLTLKQSAKSRLFNFLQRTTNHEFVSALVSFLYVYETTALLHFRRDASHFNDLERYVLDKQILPKLKFIHSHEQLRIWLNSVKYGLFHKLEDIACCKFCKSFIAEDRDGSFCSEQCKRASTRAKLEATCTKKYGVPHIFCSDAIKKKIEQTMLSKYGTAHSASVKSVRKKQLATIKRKYGASSVSDMPSTRILLSIAGKSFETKAKKYKTHKKNHSFNSSKPEEVAYKYLHKLFKEKIIRQKLSEEFPYKVDFYVPSKKLYIDLNESWTHGSMPFTNSKKCKKQLEVWKEKSVNSDFFKKAIYTWTDLDVRKRKLAKQLKMNRLEFYSVAELIDNLEKLYGKKVSK